MQAGYSILDNGKTPPAGGIGEDCLENYFHVRMDKREVDAVSALGLAHLGDGVFELLVRARLCTAGRTSQTALHRETVRQVSAAAQAARVERLLPLLSEEERGYYHRGRNAHPHHSVPRGASPQQYARASGLETLFGALYLLGRRDRLNELFNLTMDTEEDHAP